MTLIDDPYELTTAVTDLVIAALAFLGVLVAFASRQEPDFTSLLWMGFFATLMAGSFWGAVIHGLAWSPAQIKKLWMPLHVTLAIIVALLVACGSVSALGEAAAKQWFVFLLPIALLFSLYLVLMATSFIPFTVYQAAGCLLALILFGLAAKRGEAGAVWMTLGVLIITLSAGIQGLAPLRVKLIWPFDHNGVYHIAQMPGLLMLVWGVHINFLAAAKL